MKSPRMFLLVLVPVFVLLAVAPRFVRADDAASPVVINLDVEGPAGAVFNQNVSVPACAAPNSATSTINGFCAFAAAGLSVDATSTLSGVQINSIGGVAGNWQWSLNGNIQAAGIDSYILQTDDVILWSLPTPPEQHITLTIRDGSVTAFSGSVVLPDQSALDFAIMPTNSTSTVAVSPRSVLGVLESLDASSTSFDITDLAYFSSFNSFLINCITITVPAATSTPACFNWTDAINGAYPQVGADHQLLNDGDVVYLFFGSPRQTVLSTNSVTSGQPFTAAAQQYDLTTGAYIPLTGVTLGVGTQNPDFSFTELATEAVDTNGQAIFTLNTAGTFSVGIQEDFYFPSAPITITTAATPPGGGGGGGIVHSTFNIPAALSFISGKQNDDGSFDSPLTTDWTAVAFGAVDPGAAKTKLKTYLLNPAPALSGVTDYERHAMALMSLGINPYSGTPVNYVSHIIGAFDGAQIGDSSLDNDDIFAIFPLINAGFGPGDLIIQKEAAFIVSRQQPDGSWDESPDMTAAGIQAVGSFFGVPNVSSKALGQSLGMADHYLRLTQKPDGGWGNVDSTAWVATSENAARAGDPAHFVPLVSSAGYFPTDALAKAQQQDGGVESPNRLWSTSYAVAAASGKGWLSILQPFVKPAASGSGGNPGSAGSVLGTSTSTITNLPTPTATSTSATSTQPIIATSTPVIVMPTSTPVAAILLKPKIHKPLVKTQNAAQPPAVLGEITTRPSAPVPQAPVPANPNPPGFFGRLWRAITSFFRRVF